MKDPQSYVIPDISKGYRKVAKTMLTTFWVLAALFGTAVAVGLGLSRNDWIFFTSSFSADIQATGGWVALIAAYGAAAILGIYSLVAILRNRLWLLLPLSGLAAAFPALLYAPHWAPFALGGGATFLGLLALKIADRSDQKRKAAALKAAAAK
ncbi:MAG: hypothetical protein QY323_00565 [Patescibacteria group bacterium]|nr:MAG: hypothetical protein QY323_00565 [Patescibacteria group bacterium]